MITEQEAEKLELEFMDAMPEWRNYSKEKAKGLYKAWNHLWALMEKRIIFVIIWVVVYLTGKLAIGLAT